MFSLHSSRSFAESVNSFISEAEPCDEVKRVVAKLAQSKGCSLYETHQGRPVVVQPKLCPPLSDLRIFGFDTEDFVPFNSTFNIDAYSNYLLGVGYDNIMQCYSLRSQLPAISRLENIAIQARADKERTNLPTFTAPAVPNHYLAMQAQQPRFNQPAALASLKQPPFYRPPG